MAGGGRPVRSRDDQAGGPDGADAQALSDLDRDWGRWWLIGCGDGRWRAARRGAAGPVLIRASAEGLAMALRISFGRPR